MDPAIHDMPHTSLRELGPVQILTVAFDGNHFKGEILPELERLKTLGLIRVIDLLLIRKDSMGAAATLTATDLDWEEAADFGAMVGGLIGWGVGGAEGAEIGWIAGAADSADGHTLDEDDKFALLQTVPNGSSVAIVLIEHVWAKPLRAAVKRADGVVIADSWLRPEDLVSLGQSMAVSDDDGHRGRWRLTVRLAFAAAVSVVATAALASGCGGAGAITRTVTRTVPSLPATTQATPTVSTLPTETPTTPTRPTETTPTETTPTRPTQTRPTTTVPTSTVATTAPATTVTQTTTQTKTVAVTPPATTTGTTTSTGATTTGGVNTTAVVVATGVVAASNPPEEEQTPWGWIAFGILAAGVIVFLIVWLVRRNRDKGSPPGPTAETA